MQEDLDLTAFSEYVARPLASDSLQAKTALPIKAAYREGLVGMRYLHPITASTETPKVSNDPTI